MSLSPCSPPSAWVMVWALPWPSCLMPHIGGGLCLEETHEWQAAVCFRHWRGESPITRPWTCPLGFWRATRRPTPCLAKKRSHQSSFNYRIKTPSCLKTFQGYPCIKTNCSEYMYTVYPHCVDKIPTRIPNQYKTKAQCTYRNHTSFLTAFCRIV